MIPEIKLVISHNDKIIHTVNQAINKHGLVKAIEDFQIVANSTMTKLIEDSGDSIMEEYAEESDNEDEDICISPKKKKK